jgi:hypothetical protein
MNSSIPYLLTLASKTPNLPRFLKSLDNLGEFEYIPVTFDTFPGHIAKWGAVPRHLDPERYVIFSDTDDVIFQRGFPEFTHDLYLGPENVLHKDTMWKAHCEFPSMNPLMEKEVYNCGGFAMKVKEMYAYADFIDSFDKSGYGAWESRLEQVYFNMFIHLRKDLGKVIDRKLFCPLFANVYHGVRKVDGIWKDVETVIVAPHANGAQHLKEQL